MKFWRAYTISAPIDLVWELIIESSFDLVGVFPTLKSMRTISECSDGMLLEFCYASQTFREQVRVDDHEHRIRLDISGSNGTSGVIDRFLISIGRGKARLVVNCTWKKRTLTNLQEQQICAVLECMHLALKEKSEGLWCEKGKSEMAIKNITKH